MTSWTYEEYLNCEDKEIFAHGEENGKPLVLGWLFEGERDIRYAQHVDGGLLRMDTNGILDRDIYMNQPRVKWLPCDNIPLQAIWIGRYPDTMFKTTHQSQ